MAKIYLEKALLKEEAFWKENARIKWHCEGDTNIAYSNKLIKIKQAIKKIYVLKIGDSITYNPNIINSIVKHVINLFTNSFSSANYVQDNHLIEETIPRVISDRMNVILTLIPILEEISYVSCHE